MKDTLILNTDGRPLSMVPLSTCSWQEAVKLLFVDRVDVLSTYEDWTVHSPSMTIEVPAIIMLRDYVKTERNVRFSRSNVLLRDDYQCQYCGVDMSSNPTELTLDHVIPRFHGGRTKWDNVVAACPSCNFEKSHYDHMRPMKAAHRPTYHELVNKRRKHPIVVPHQSWAAFLNWDEKLVQFQPNERAKKNHG